MRGVPICWAAALVIAACAPRAAGRVTVTIHSAQERARGFLGPAATLGRQIHVEGLPGSSPAFALLIEYRLLDGSSSAPQSETSWGFYVWRATEHVTLEVGTHELPAHIGWPSDTVLVLPDSAPPPPVAVLSTPGPRRGDGYGWRGTGGELRVGRIIDRPICPAHTAMPGGVDDPVPAECEPGSTEVELDLRLHEPSHQSVGFPDPWEFFAEERWIRIRRQRVPVVIVEKRCSFANQRKAECAR